ncbi:MAG TPA: DNA-binding domain-containing protein [Polyangiaceae bacterium]|nr:DNA-binding domain-containing protein [Polyangiaceae bacterium]
MTAHAPALSLATLEDWLVAVNTEPGELADALERAARRCGVNATAADDLERVVTRGPRLSALERLSIYRDGYVARLVECLADDYPALACALGELEFGRLARDYIAAHPSRSPSLDAHGAALPAYLDTRSEAWARCASDLARLEWALVEVVHAETKPPLTADAVAGLDPGDFARARLTASPALRVLGFAHPVNRFYQAFCEDSAGELPGPESSAVAVHRAGLSVYRLELEPTMRLLLSLLTGGETLGDALATLERELSPAELTHVQTHLAEWFGAWIAAGFFTALELP